jgi:hypothetical protein
MANQIPFSGATSAAGGYLLPDAQGEILTNALLKQAGGLAVAGDRRATSSRKTNFPIWLGAPTAGFVGEGAKKPVTGGEFGQGSINIKKVASTVLFTEEQVEDVQNGDLNVLVDSGVRTAIADVIDAHIVGKSSGTNLTTSFDSMLRSTTSTVEFTQASNDSLRKAISAAMGTLEGNGYTNQDDMAVLLGPGFAQHIRDARSAVDATTQLYVDQDPAYGLQREFSTNLNSASTTAGANIIKAFVVYKPNLHVRIRKDVTLKVSREATVDTSAALDGSALRNLWQENLTGVLYETRLGFFIHDINRAVVAIVDAT